MEITNLTLEQNNALVKLAKANIPFFVTGRYSYESMVEPSDLDLIIPQKYKEEVEKILVEDKVKNHEGSKPDPARNKQRVFYKHKVDILYLEDQNEWDEYDMFSRVEQGIKITHPAHSMLAKVRMILKTVESKHASSFKHGKDLEEYIRKTLTTDCGISNQHFIRE